MVFAFLNSDSGFINNAVLKVLGMAPVSWYTKSNIWPFILILVFLWQTVGHTSIIYMASIAGIDKGIYEAAKIDGAGEIKQIFYHHTATLKANDHDHWFLWRSERYSFLILDCFIRYL